MLSGLEVPQTRRIFNSDFRLLIFSSVELRKGNEIRTGGLARSSLEDYEALGVGRMACCVYAVDAPCAERKCESARHNESGFCFKHGVDVGEGRKTYISNVMKVKEKGENEIIYKRILMDDRLLENLFSL